MANGELRPQQIAAPPSANRLAAEAARFGALPWTALFAVVFYLSLFLYSSVTRTRQFSPDSMNYVDVARNLATGRGLVQSTLGYNQIYLFRPDSTPPLPFTSQPPVFPMLIALASRGGLTYADAALVIPGVAYGMVLLLGYLLGRDLYNERAALLAVALLLIFQPLNFVAGVAWSEIVSVVFVLLSLWLLVGMRRSTEIRSTRLFAFAAGLAAGLAFSTRYALVPLFGAGLFFIIRELRSGNLRLEALLLYVFGFGVPAGLVMGDNWIQIGALLPPAFASDRDLISNVSDTLWSLFGDYSPIGSSEMQVVAAAAILVALALTLGLQKRLRDLPDIFLKDGRYLLLLWSAGYLAFVVVLRTVSYFSPIDDRLTFPAGTVLIILFSALCAHVVGAVMQGLRRWRGRAATAGEGSGRSDWQIWNARRQIGWLHNLSYGIVMVIGLVLSLGEIGVIQTVPAYNLQETIAGSARLSWILSETTDRDLIIGDDTMDVPFYLGRDQAVSFSAYPHTVFLTYPLLTQFADHNCPLYENIYLVLRDHSDWTYKDQLHLYGRFISDLDFGRLGNYPRVAPLKQLSDASVYQVRCPQ